MKKLFVIVFKIVLLFSVYAFFVEPNIILTKKYTITNKDLSGLKIVFVGDFHIRPYQKNKLKRIVTKINSQNPDIILSIGDYINGHKIEASLKPSAIVDELTHLKSRYGFYTVLGNHDNWYVGISVENEFNKKNLVVLDNSNIKIDYSGKDFFIAGVEDLYTGEPDVKKALNNTTNPVILLTHNPDVFVDVPESVDLTLAGHTHGGQVRFPFLGALVIPSKYGNKYAKGLIEEDKKKMIVTTGLGTSILHLRFNCFPEIVVIDFVN
ncbi:MAG: metallophosphoesterase [Candidatus Gastranaerophilales bacterium]